MAHESEPTADSPQPGPPDSTGDLHDAPTRSAVPQRHAGAIAALSPPLPRGAVFGHYTIEAVLGEGGMGVVYRARQERPAREVALKVIRPGLASSQALRRFELEAEVLGRLQHPGIAQVFEAGTTPEGQPFFAMELVRGESLIRYADLQALSTRERLELFAKVCDAVQHAHTKGVIHRDLKPVNILVDSTGQPKILDFGVARVTQHDVQAVTIQTDLGQIIGTVPYMSPEQIEGDPANLDTRSDVYALGVILYELLTGRMPYDLSKKLIHEAARIIQEDEPTRLSSINRALRGDIETIALKALEKDKARRYQAASDLGSDITRFLRSEPIVARPASRRYQLRKFAQRNKALVGGVIAAFVLLAAGLVGTSYGLVRAEEQRRIAHENELRAQSEAARAIAAEAETKQRADELQKVSDFQSNMLAQIDPTTAGVRLTEDVNRKFEAALEKMGVPEAERSQRAGAFRQEWLRVNATNAALALIDETILKPAVKAIDEQFKDQPVVDAQLRQVLADRYRELGLLDAALPLQTSALNTRRRALGEEHPDTLSSINHMGVLLRRQGRLTEAEPYCQEAMEKCERVLGEEHLITLTSISNMGALLQAQGKLAESEPFYRDALEVSRRVLGDEHPDTLISISNMGALLGSQGRYAESEPYYREALEISRRALGNDHPSTLASIGNMGNLLQNQGRSAEAELYLREALEGYRRVLGDEHPSTLTGINNMGALLDAQGRFAEAALYIREALEVSRRVLGNEHSSTLTGINNMGVLLDVQGRYTEAEPYYREALEARRRVLGEEHPNTIQSINNMGILLQSQGRLAEAEPYFRDALEKRLRILGEDHPSTLISFGSMGSLLRAQGHLAEAEPYCREAMERSRRVLGDEHPISLALIGNMGALLVAQQDHAEAVALLKPIEISARAAFTKANARRLAALLMNLGTARAGLHDFAAAEANLLEAQSIFVATRGPTHKDTLDCTQALVDLYMAWDAAELGKGYDLKAGEWKAKLEAPSGGGAE